MFSFTEAIIRLRDRAPIFSKRVAGTSEFILRAGQPGLGDDMATPHCFIVPMTDTADLPKGNEVAQLVTEVFGTIVCIDQAIDKRNGPGMSAADILRQARHEMIDAFLNWKAGPLLMPVRYLRGYHLSMNSARIWHQFEWQVQYYICRTESVANEETLDFEGRLADSEPYATIQEIVTRASVNGSTVDVERFPAEQGRTGSLPGEWRSE